MCAGMGPRNGCARWRSTTSSRRGWGAGCASRMALESLTSGEVPQPAPLVQALESRRGPRVPSEVVFEPFGVRRLLSELVRESPESRRVLSKPVPESPGEPSTALRGGLEVSREQSSALLNTRRVSKTAFECSSRVSRTPSESSRLLSGRLGHPSREQSSAVGEARRPRRRALESSFGASRPRVDAGSSFREAREGRLGSTPRPRGEGLDFEAVRAAEKRRAGAGGATSATPCRCVACSP